MWCNFACIIPWHEYAVFQSWKNGAWLATRFFCHPKSHLQTCHKHIMMPSSNGNIFSVTGHLCGEFTGQRWITRTKPSDTEVTILWLLKVDLSWRTSHDIAASTVYTFCSMLYYFQIRIINTVNTPPPFFFKFIIIWAFTYGAPAGEWYGRAAGPSDLCGALAAPTGVSLWITSQDVSTWSAGTITYCKVIWQCLWAAVWIWNHFTVL